MLHVIGGILVNYYLWKEFDDVSKEKTSKWFNGLSLLCLFSMCQFVQYKTNIQRITR